MPEGPLQPRAGKARNLPYDLKKMSAAQEKDLRALLETVIKAQQENNDSLHGDMVGFMKKFNLLARDVAFLAEMMGVEIDPATGEPTEASGVQLAHGDLDSVTANQHHNQAHAMHGPDHTGSLRIPVFPQGEQGEPGMTIPGRRGATGATGSRGPGGPPGQQAEDGTDGMSIPGPRGATGAQGNPGQSIPGASGADGIDGLTIPGPRGQQGETGRPGTTVPGWAGEDGEAGMALPGRQGDTGPQGVPGRTIPGWAGADGEAGMALPGRPGAPGATGAQGIAGRSTPPPGAYAPDEDAGFGAPVPPSNERRDIKAHAAATDPHTGYRLESEDHTHASSGAQGGQVDHGALTGLSDDDHPQYATNTEFDDHSARHENGGADEISIAGLDGTPTELTNHVGAADPHTGYRLESADHTHASTGAQAGQLDHGTALTGLSDDDHPQYVLEASADITGDLKLSNSITPTALAANTNNWAPTGIDEATVVEINLDTHLDLTGIDKASANGADGRLIILINVDPDYNVTLKHQSASSSAGNKFYCPAEKDHLLQVGQSCFIIWNASSDSWHVIGGGAIDWGATNPGSVSESSTNAQGSTVSLAGAAHTHAWGGADVQSFTADGTWTKPANATWTDVICIGGGGAGGAGGRSNVGASPGGGGGGGGGAFVWKRFATSSLSATETVTVGAGGGTTAGRSTNGTGATGATGEDTTFGTKVTAKGGTGGTGGSAGGAGTGGAGQTGGSFMSSKGGTAGDGGNAATGSAGTNIYDIGAASAGAAGGGGGGGTTAGSAARVGGAGGDCYDKSGGTAGAGAGGAGGQGGQQTAGIPAPGAGGGGASSNVGGANGGDGGAGGRYGGGGGGGGGCETGGTSGDGGAGADGICFVVSV